MMSNAITSPIVRPAVLDHGPRGSTAVPKTANTRKNVVVASITMPLPAAIPDASAGVPPPPASYSSRGTKYFSRNAPATAPWLDKALGEASRKHFGKDVMWMGEGGTIPFMAMLGAKYPQAQFLITGVLGPHSNAHGPNEFLHIEYAKKLTACVADVVAAHASDRS